MRKKKAVWSVRWWFHCLKLLASPWFSFANSDRSGNPICSDVSQIQLDSSAISWLTVITSLTCCISLVASSPCGSSRFPAYRGLALVKTVPSSLLPVVFVCFPHPWHLLPVKLGFSNSLHLHCLHFTRVCGLCHYSSISNSGNVSGNYLAGCNKTDSWSSSVLLQAFH